MKKLCLLISFAVSACAQVTMRGTPTIQGYAAAANVQLALPVAAVAGDLAIVGISNPDSVFVASGWVGVAQSGLNIAGVTQYKAITSTDISNGYVQVTTDGSFPSVGYLVVIAGPSATRIRDIANSQNASGSATRTLTTAGTVLTTDLGIFFGTSRGGTVTAISPGTSVGTGTSTFINGRLSTDTSLSAGANTITYNYSGSSADYQSYVIVKLATPAGNKVFPILY